jgi:predicted GNAT family acetyltransferase
VYNPKARPWINLENTNAEDLINQVAKCPSGALSIKPDHQMLIRIEREDNGRKGRFVLYQNDEFAGEMTYVWAGTSRFIIDHTGVEESFNGRGLGKQLVMKAVEYARDNALKILPLCPFAKKVFDKDDSIQDVRV